MKRVKVCCSVCGKPFRKKAKYRYHIWELKRDRDYYQEPEFCNQCKKEIKNHEK